MRRIVANSLIRQAYKIEDKEEKLIDEKVETVREKTDRLPGEIFQIVGDLIDFIEIVNKLEGKNEDK